MSLISRSVLLNKFPGAMLNSVRPSSDLSTFKNALSKAKNVVVITGAGISAESGIPTFRGPGGFWRRYQAQDLASLNAFKRDPGLVWEFYHYRRELVRTRKPNPAHFALAEFETKWTNAGRSVTVITQNIDELHKAAGTKQLIELHGSLYKTLCTSCGDVRENKDSPICPSLAGKGAPEPDAKSDIIDPKLLPRCATCQGLLRPFVVWFGENLDANVLQSAQNCLQNCDFCIVIGTSAVVYPAAMFAPAASARGIPVAEFNIETTSTTQEFSFYFEGPAGQTLPPSLDISPT